MDALVPPNGTHPGFVVNDESHGPRSYEFGHYHILNDVGNNSRAVLNAVGDSARAGIKETSDVGRNLQSDICKASHDGIQAGASQAAETRAVAAATQASVERNFVETRAALERNSAEGRIANLTSFASLDKFLCDKFGDNVRDVIGGFKDAQLFAAQNAAKLSAELSHCCCEMKELVRSETGATRELIRSNESQRLRDELLLCKMGVGSGGPGNSGLR